MSLHKRLRDGTTLSQRGLSIRIDLNVSTIRRRGQTVMGFVNGDDGYIWREFWKKKTYADGRIHYYELKDTKG